MTFLSATISTTIKLIRCYTPLLTGCGLVEVMYNLMQNLQNGGHEACAVGVEFARCG